MSFCYSLFFIALFDFVEYYSKSKQKKVNMLTPLPEVVWDEYAPGIPSASSLGPAPPAGSKSHDPAGDPPTAEELEAVAEMRSILSAELAAANQSEDVVGDSRLCRFYRGHGSVKQACKYAKANLEWRKKHGLDAIREEVAQLSYRDMIFSPSADAFLAYYPMHLQSGWSKAGDLLQFQRPGMIKPRAFYRAATTEEHLAYNRRHIEWLNLRIYHAEATLKRTVRIFTIMDMRGMGMQHMWRPGLKLLSSIIAETEDNYPEMLSCFCALHAPSSFAWCTS